MSAPLELSPLCSCWLVIHWSREELFGRLERAGRKCRIQGVDVENLVNPVRRMRSALRQLMLVSQKGVDPRHLENQVLLACLLVP